MGTVKSDPFTVRDINWFLVIEPTEDADGARELIFYLQVNICARI